MYFYIISCQKNILVFSTVSITKHIYCVNLIIFIGDFEDELTCKLVESQRYLKTGNLDLDHQDQIGLF